MSVLEGDGVGRDGMSVSLRCVRERLGKSVSWRNERGCLVGFGEGGAGT